MALQGDGGLIDCKAFSQLGKCERHLFSVVTKFYLTTSYILHVMGALISFTSGVASSSQGFQ